MLNGRARAGRPFRPTIEGRLEDRKLLAHLAPGAVVRVGGRAANLRDVDNELYRVTVADVTPAGAAIASVTPTVLARKVANGQFDLYVYGSSTNTSLVINPIPHPLADTFYNGKHRFKPGTDFPYGSIKHDGLVHIRNIYIKTGQIGEILAYRTADINGTIFAGDTTAISRIAVFGINPGGGVQTGGDIDTFDVLNDINLSGGNGIDVGRDLNWLNVGGNVTVINGSNFIVRRYIGLTAQAAKGTDPGGVGGLIGGQMIVGPDSVFAVGGAILSRVLVQGTIDAAPGSIQINAGGNNLVSLGNSL